MDIAQQWHREEKLEAVKTSMHRSSSFISIKTKTEKSYILLLEEYIKAKTCTTHSEDQWQCLP